ncbi:glycoside hydrolase family 2 protein [Lentzea sp. NPDC003310]|uniref:glycoside hydrolase family 2 protein n=1 Tax=Lentzea sp. NPDC003310 TaxID=3154447 RepID=UPI0033A243DF
MTRTELHQGWTVRAVGESRIGARVVPAAVPGCVHTDLLAAGLIPDPYLDENESKLAWIGRADWRYETVFQYSAAEDTQVELVCDGLDTVARIELNGQEVASTYNMHRRYRFDVRAALRDGENHLAVTFTSALEHAEDQERLLGARPHVNSHPYNMIRKMACNFGWDWGPDLVTAGIWRPLAIEEWRTARIAAVRPLTSADGVADVHVEVRRTGGGPLTVLARIGEHEVRAELPPGSDETVLRLELDDVERWWPRGYGEQKLYPLEVALSTGDTWRGEVGFRTVELLTDADVHGTEFTFRINGERIFVKGVNWIPDDCFPHRVDRARLAERFDQALGAGVNLLRVWGGGIYESDDFYSLADERGLLVWQDFLFACAAYPEEEPLRGEVVAEARDAVTRLAGHPSLIAWNGGNENIWGYHDWGWQELLGERSWGIGYYTDVLPKIVAELDPSRPYLPSSPYSVSADLHPNDPAHGCTHIWDVWNDRDYTAYLDYEPRFVAEFGFCGPATRTTVTEAIHDEPLAPYGRGMTAHMKAEDGNRKIARRLAEHFPDVRGFDDWHWAAQLNQAHAVSTGIEHFRSLWPKCSGTILWQLNDCWPVTSWAVVDGRGRRKPAWYALRAAYAPRLLTIKQDAVVVVNDTAEQWAGEVRVRCLRLDGAQEAEAVLPFIAGPRAALTLALPVRLADVVVASAGDVRSVAFFGGNALPAPVFDAGARAVEGGYRVTVTARSVLKDLTLLADDCEVDRGLVTLLPGETAVFEVRTSAAFAPKSLLAPDVLRSANQLRG